MNVYSALFKCVGRTVVLAGVFSSSLFADNLDLIRQVIINNSAMGIYYELVSIDNDFCRADGYLSPGKIKILNCTSPDVSAYGTYILEVQPEGWQGYAMHDSMFYTVTHNAQVTWNLAVAVKSRGEVLGISVDETLLTNE